MPIQKYDVSLSTTERKRLTKIVKSGKMPARTIMRANILLAVDRNGKSPMTVQKAALAFNTSATTVQKVRACYGEKGLDATLNRKKRDTPPVAYKATGDVEARIIALTCTDPPKGFAKWTLRLLADRSVKLDYVDSISHIQVGRILKNEFKPHLKKCWCIPSKSNASFVAAMEDVLEEYSRPSTTGGRLSAWMRSPFNFCRSKRRFHVQKHWCALRRQRVREKRDVQYFPIHKATCKLATCRDEKAKNQDGLGKRIKWLLDDMYPSAVQVVLICDNLNTHNIASLYETIEPEESLRLAKRLEIHHIPKHDCWLVIAEIELSALGNQCLSKRKIDSIEKLNEELLSWNNEEIQTKRVSTGSSKRLMRG